MTSPSITHTRVENAQKAERVSANPSLKVRTLLHLSQERFARLLDVSSRTVVRWEKGDGQPDPYMQKKLHRLEQVVNKVSKNGEPHVILKWLEKPDSDLRGYAPLDLLGSNYATEVLLERIEGWGYGAS